MAVEWRFLLHKLKKLFLCHHQSQPNKKILEGASAKECTVHGANLGEQMKHATDAATAAAEAAMVAAQAAAAVARLAVQQIHGEEEVYNWAATKIQTCFRGYIARKAHRALKAMVRLQAIARGRALRRQLQTQLKGSQSFTKREQEGQLHCTKDLEEALSRRCDKRQGYMARQSWAGERLQRSAVLENLLPNLNTNAGADGGTSSESPFSITRRSCSQARERWGEEESSSPGYMAATASAMARMRSVSTPRRRIRFPDQCHSDRRRDGSL